MRCTISSSSRTASSSSLFSSTANSGSTKSVSPDTERSCTTPGSWRGGAGAHRHDEAVVAQRDVGVGDRRRPCCAARTRSSSLRVSVSRRRRIAARTRASASLAWSSTVAVVVERALQRRLELRERRPADRRRSRQRPALGGVAAEEGADRADGLQRLAHRDQRLAVEHEALVRGAAQVRAHVGEGAQRRLAVLLEEAEALPGALERRVGDGAVGHRRQRAAALLPGARRGEARPGAHIPVGTRAPAGRGNARAAV